MAVRPIRKDVENTFRQAPLVGSHDLPPCELGSYPLDAFARVQAGCTPDSSITDDTWGAWAR